MLDLQFGGPEFTSRPDRPLAGFVLDNPDLSSTTPVNSQLVCIRPVGILNPIMFSLIIYFRHLFFPTSISAINNAEGK